MGIAIQGEIHQNYCETFEQQPARQAFTDALSRKEVWYTHENQLMLELADGNLEKAAAIAKKGSSLDGGFAVGLCVAILARKNGDTDLCQKTLKSLRTYRLPAASGQWRYKSQVLYKRLVSALTPYLTGERRGRGRLRAIDAALARLPWDRRIPYDFYIGWALDVVGKHDQAVTYYKRCISPLYTPVPERTLAFVHLRQHHIDPLAVMTTKARANTPADLHLSPDQPLHPAGNRNGSP